MQVFRISTIQFADQLIASGAENRWNKRGQFVIYTGGSRSLSTIELVVHKGTTKPNVNYKVMVIYFPDDDNLVRQVLINELPSNWRTTLAYSELQNIGGLWYNNQETLILKVPSAVIPLEHNYIINTKHPDFHSVQLIHTEEYFWDDRLFPSPAI
jgi:RES domain-containing protein